MVLRRFDGDERPWFGRHGTSSKPSTLTLFDLASNSERPIDDIIAVEPLRRWMLVLEGGDVWLIDGTSGTWQALEGVDETSDRNICLAPRQATFSPTGKRLGWIRTGATTFTVRDLETQQAWSISATGRLWRAWPLDETHAAVLAEVADGTTEWPVQQTSCRCRWCGRFAMSSSIFGWAGPDFTFVQVDENGTRTSRSGPPELDGDWHGETESGCTLTPTSENAELERGPWRWRCL